MTQQKMVLLVPQKLKEIEKEYGIRVLYAVGSGSRAWGTNSESSDFDIRFLYIRPREDYLRLVPHRDVLEFGITDGWDMCGWDLSKLLKLLHNANSQIYEWFISPVVYVDDGLSERIRPLLEEFDTIEAMSHIDFYEQDLVRHPIASLTSIEKFRGIVPELYGYYCVSQPNCTNRFFKMPLARTRIRPFSPSASATFFSASITVG